MHHPHLPRSRPACLPPGCGGYADHRTTLAQLTAHGDEVVAERRYSEQETAAENEQLTAAIRARALQISARRPELARVLADYVARQEQWDRLLGREIICATWLLRVA